MVVCLTENHDFNSHDIAGLYKITGAVVFIENLFLEISQNSQENTCTRVFF